MFCLLTDNTAGKRKLHRWVTSYTPLREATVYTVNLYMPMHITVYLWTFINFIFNLDHLKNCRPVLIFLRREIAVTLLTVHNKFKTLNHKLQLGSWKLLL